MQHLFNNDFNISFLPESFNEFIIFIISDIMVYSPANEYQKKQFLEKYLIRNSFTNLFFGFVSLIKFELIILFNILNSYSN